MSLEAWGDENPDYGWNDESVDKAIVEGIQEYIDTIADWIFLNFPSSGFHNLKLDLSTPTDPPQEIKDLLKALTDRESVEDHSNES